MNNQVARGNLSVDSDVTILSVQELARGDVTQLTTWMASRDYRTNEHKLANVLCWSIIYNNINISQAIIDSGRLLDEHLAQALTMACTEAGCISSVQLIVRRCRVSTQHLYHALVDCCTEGHAAIMQWLLSEIQMSHGERVTWWLATASACGDINSVRLISAQVGRDHTNFVSQALRSASYKGRVDVVDWLMTHTTANASLRGEITDVYGTITSLAVACYEGHADTVVTLLRCVMPHTVNIPCGKCMDSALHFTIWYTGPSWYRGAHLQNACVTGDRERVDSLLYSADVNEQNHTGCTSLHNACQNDDKYIVQSLLSVFASTDITDNDKCSPIDVAKKFNSNNLMSCFTPLLSSRDTTHTAHATQSAAVDVVFSDANISEARSATRGNRHSHTQKHALTRDINAANSRRSKTCVHIV